MKSILSIQSAVTVGAVGNTMANMVLTTMGHHIARVDTIQLAAHPGYGFVAGGRLDHQDFTDLINGLDRLNIGDNMDAVMTGYMAHADQTKAIGGLLASIKPQRRDWPVLIDPAIGDHGRLYVDESVAMGMASHLFPHADAITPNQFELEYFSQHSIASPDDAIEASRKILSQFQGMKGIAATGISDDDGGIVDGWITRDQAVFHSGKTLQHQPHGLSGGGDLFAAILIGDYLENRDWNKAVAKASPKAQAILYQSDAPGQGQVLPQAINDHLSLD